MYENGDETVQRANEIQTLLVAIDARATKLTFYQKELGMKLTEFTEISEMVEKFSKIVEMWTILLEWDVDSNTWIKISVFDLNAYDISVKVTSTKKRIVKLMNIFKENPFINKLCMTCINAINLFDINYMEMMLILRDESFRERHWKDLLTHIYKDEIHPKLETLNFKQLIEKNIKNHKSKINQLAEKARNEYIVEYKIEEIQKSMGNSQVIVKQLAHSKQMVISNAHSICFSFQENKQKCEDMLRSSEHLETFLKKIYDVHSNIMKLERYVGYILLIQDLLSTMKIIELLPSVDNELKTKDRTLLRTLLSKYHNIFDDMKARGLNMILRQIEDEEERKENHAQEETTMTDEIYVQLNHALRYPNHAHAHMFLTMVYSKMKGSIVQAFSLVPRFLNLTIEQLCYHIHLAQAGKKLSGLELFFPEIKDFMGADGGASSIVGAVFVNGESMLFENPIQIGCTYDEDLLQLYPQKVESLEKEIQLSIKYQIFKILNFFLLNTYNFEKFIAYALEVKFLTQAFETAIKAVFAHDVSLMLENPMVTVTKDIVKTRLTKYMQLIVNPLRKINAIHFRETLNLGDAERLKSLEGFILLLVYLADFLREFIANNETKFSSFFWQSKLKVSLKIFKDKAAEDLSKQDVLENYMKTISFTLNNLDKFSNLFMISLGLRNLSIDKFSLAITAFEDSIQYGYQPTSCPGKLIFTCISERSTVNLFLELARSSFAGIRGHDYSGRKSTIHHLADVAGRFCPSLDLSLKTGPLQLTTALVKSMGSQYWMVIENTEHTSDLVLLELAKVILALRKVFVSSGRRFINVDKVEYLVSSDFAMIMVQSNSYTSPKSFSKIPDTVLAEFRCSCFLSVDMLAFIYNQLSELIYFDEYNQKAIFTISRQLYLMFQLMHTGLSDKVFVTTQLQSDGPAVLDDILTEPETWRATLRSIKPILSKLRTSLRTEHKTLPTSRIIYKAIYNTLKYQLNPHQKESLMLNFISIFEPGSDLFRIVDGNIQETGLALYSFMASNKIPGFSNLGLVEKVQSLAETLVDRESRVVVNFGSNLQICAPDFNKLQQYIYSLKSGAPSCTGRSY